MLNEVRLHFFQNLISIPVFVAVFTDFISVRIERRIVEIFNSIKLTKTHKSRSKELLRPLYFYSTKKTKKLR